MAYDPYTKTSGAVSVFYPRVSGTEVNLRQELIDMFDGKWPEIPKASVGLVRHMRRDTHGKLILCGCVDPVTKEPDKDRYCPICMGEGYLWDETFIQYRKQEINRPRSNLMADQLSEAGLINAQSVVFYVRYDSVISLYDKIIILDLDLEGAIVEPYSRKQIFRVVTLWDARSDNGRVEYWKVFTHEDTVKHLNPPSFEEA